MEKIFRLARANIRRHKKETVLLGILIMLCMMLLAGAVSAERSIKAMFSDLTARSGAWENRLYIQTESYHPQMHSLLQADERVTGSAVYEYLYSYDTRILDENGKEKPFVSYFITAENDRLYESYAPQTAFIDAELADLAHPIFVPHSQQKKLGLHEGDLFSIIRGSRKYTFTVAGFYTDGYWEAPKFVVTEADYAVLKNICNRWTEMGFTLKEGADCEAVGEDWEKNCDEAGIHANFGLEPQKYMRSNFNMETGYIVKIIEIMALIILIAVAVMIGYRIVSDIQDQIVSIGVLEALGYRSREIARAYALEYLLIAVCGCAAGTVLGIGLHAGLIRIAENMKGYAANHAVSWGAFAVIFLGLLLIIAATAYRKSRAVRKYPPVLAFRRGIQNHHFGKSHYPLAKTRKNVHLRLAMKGYADRGRRNAGLTFVMSITTLAVVLSFILYSFLGKGVNVITSLAGHELCDLEIETVTGIDCDAFEAELNAMPEIRKVLATASMGEYMLTDSAHNGYLLTDIYRDYSQTENIQVMEGRFPQHANELMTTKQYAVRARVGVGDALTLKYDSIEQEYMITGIVTAVANPESVYLTEAGMQRVCPTYRPTAFQIYRSEGTDNDALRAELDRRYGKSAQSLGSAEESISGSYEERVRAKAEQVMAAMLQQSGATHVEYAITAGDTVISGSSSGIMIQGFLNISELLEDTLNDLCGAIGITTRLFMAMSAAVVLIILTILMESEVRRQRRDLGIMKGLGYTARELMLQLAFRIMPTALLAVVIGTVLSVGATKLMVSAVGVVPINLPQIIVLDLLILAFCFGCAWLGAGKIRKISVYELMTE